MSQYQDILEECIDISNQREEKYGDIYTNFTRIQDIYKAMFDRDIKLSEIIEIMIATKVSREKEKHQLDNTIDVINYYAIREKFIESETNIPLDDKKRL